MVNTCIDPMCKKTFLLHLTFIDLYTLFTEKGFDNVVKNYL